MSDTSPNLALPFIAPSQAQKHVTHNEAIEMLDALVQLAVASRVRTSPPEPAHVGGRWIVADDAEGDWAGHDGQVAVRIADGWTFHAPRPGWQAWIADEGGMAVWTGAHWAATAGRLTPEELRNLPEIGVNAVADETNRLSVAADATLFSHDGEGHRLKVNKAGPGETASLLFQSGFSGRAEMGLAGEDAFSVKVSANGTGFATALRADPATGRVSFPAGLALGGETLSAYDAGSWTPALSFGGAAAGLTYASRSGRWVRIGRLVTAQARVVLSARGTSAGAAEVAGLPLVAAEPGTPGMLLFAAGGSGLTYPCCRTLAGGRLALLNRTATGTAPLTEARFGATAEFALSVSYAV